MRFRCARYASTLQIRPKRDMSAQAKNNPEYLSGAVGDKGHTPSDIKRALRKERLSARNEMDKSLREKKSSLIAKKLVADSAFKDARIVFAYFPTGSETDTRSVIKSALKAGKTVALAISHPDDKSLEWHSIKDTSKLIAGFGGILEPQSDARTLIGVEDIKDKTAIAIVPGVVFDREGFRIGYGGGFYDRFLSEFGGITIGYTFEEQIAPSLVRLGAIEAHDMKVDRLISA